MARKYGAHRIGQFVGMANRCAPVFSVIRHGIHEIDRHYGGEIPESIVAVVRHNARALRQVRFAGSDMRSLVNAIQHHVNELYMALTVYH